MWLGRSSLSRHENKGETCWHRTSTQGAARGRQVFSTHSFDSSLPLRQVLLRRSILRTGSFNDPFPAFHVSSVKLSSLVGQPCGLLCAWPRTCWGQAGLAVGAVLYGGVLSIGYDSPTSVYLLSVPPSSSLGLRRCFCAPPLPMVLDIWEGQKRGDHTGIKFNMGQSRTSLHCLTILLST